MAEPDPEKKAFGGTLQDSIQVVEPLTVHATMYALADKYQVEGLGELAKAKFEQRLYHHSNSEDFVNAVQIAYSSTLESNRGLRAAVLKAFRVYFQVNVAEIPGLEAKLETIDELSFLLIKSWPKKTETAKSENAVKTKFAKSAGSFPAPSFGIPAPTRSLFDGIPSRTPIGFGSFLSVPNGAGNLQTRQTTVPAIGGPTSVQTPSEMVCSDV